MNYLRFGNRIDHVPLVKSRADLFVQAGFCQLHFHEINSMRTLRIRNDVDIVQGNDLAVQVLRAIVSEILADSKLAVLVLILVFRANQLDFDRSLEPLRILRFKHESIRPSSNNI